jgi:hypothetical protein
MAEIHFVCRSALNLRAVNHPIYESGVWDLCREDAARLVGRLLFLHETKAKPSYFGGRIEGFREVDAEYAHARRVVFRVTFLPEGKGAPWRGHTYRMAWTSGVVEP